MNRFIEQIKHSTEYDAGIVEVIDGNYAIAFETNGASKSFSVGMPIYDKDNNLMGYLGIGLYDGLNYGGTDVRVPCEYWQICLPTIYCKASKQVFTYWQMLERKEQE